MRRLQGEVFTYAKHARRELIFREGASLSSFGFDDVDYKLVERIGPTWAPVSKIRRWDGYPVDSFEKLVETVAQVAFGNRTLLLHFRGQQKDHKDQNGRSTLYPSICRPFGSRLTRKRLANRHSYLRAAVAAIRRDPELDLGHRIHLHEEALVALLQHYELCKTPLLDVTRSLRVAASFALMDGSPEGYIFVLGMPYPSGSISHVIDQELRLVELQSVCPYRALRPHWQEGVLIGRYPWRGTKEAGDNAAYRLVAKLRLDNRKGKFWRSGFAMIPKRALLPKRDEYGELLRKAVHKGVPTNLSPD